MYGKKINCEKKYWRGLLSNWKSRVCKKTKKKKKTIQWVHKFRACVCNMSRMASQCHLTRNSCFDSAGRQMFSCSSTYPAEFALSCAWIVTFSPSQVMSHQQLASPTCCHPSPAPHWPALTHFEIMICICGAQDFISRFSRPGKKIKEEMQSRPFPTNANRDILKNIRVRISHSFFLLNLQAGVFVHSVAFMNHIPFQLKMIYRSIKHIRTTKNMVT